ncbi:histidine kinase [Fulvivirgaceae bacterium PWU5]|uniref:Histidine kinase n=1 Tax=Dawidia cretensis TaxID=2782350 RepID=A0AAP2GR59_9BACT|nr:histidine kinase [Dawidia cretensis]MBT1710009.1 histidine kinase [Dawidia cretensis]
MKAIRHFKNTLMAQWLLHALLLWVGATAYILLFYYYRIVDNGGYYIFYEDGTPFTLWDRFYDLNVHNFFWAQVLLFTLFVETLRRWGYEQRSLRSVLLWILFTGFLVAASMGVYVYIINGQNWKALSDPMPWILFVLYSAAYIVLRGFIRHKLYRKDVQLAQSAAHLESLRAQVNPHFFFNTCNYIYGMALRENAPQTAKAMEMMSAMMRYSMTVIDENEVLLSEELTFIRHYIELQKIRIAQIDAIRIDIMLPELPDQTLLIAPMLFIPLVENAFKYGISVDRPSFITIVIQVQGKELTASIENSVHAHVEADPGMGSGLANITRRLQLLYPTRHTFTITHSATAFSVYLRLMAAK